MDPIGIIIGAFGLVLSIGIAIWQNSKARKAQADLNTLLLSLPTQVLDNVARLLRESQSDNIELYGMLDSEKRLHSIYVDLDGNGEDELMVQYPFGAHGSALQVFGFRDWEFRLVAELSIDTPAGFTAEDIDGDGRIEIVTQEVSQEADFPYVMGLRDEVWYRLEGDRFKEIKRIKLYEDIDVERVRRELKEMKEGKCTH